jgi:hypothetical protein
MCNSTTRFGDFNASFERNSGGISIVDMSVPDRLAFNLTYAKTLCYLILHLHNLSVSVTKFGVISFAEKHQADYISNWPATVARTL